MKKPIALATALCAALPSVFAAYDDWRQEGSLYILTTPEGANLPPEARLEHFPLLVRLDREWFDFSQAAPMGRDIRFSEAGQPLEYQIDTWDAENGRAAIWVRVPLIRGAARQQLTMHWGKEDAPDDSRARAVFNADNGYASVWHLGSPVVDDAGGTASKDEGTTPAPGVVGAARRFEAGKGIFGGDAITAYPSGAGPMTTEAWFRAEQTNGTVLAWGEEKRPSKVMFNFLSPPRMAIQCYFADVEARSPMAIGQWYHVVHTYSEKDSRVYVNGVLDGSSTPELDLPVTSRLWIGGWYGNYSFVGDVDEVRISKVARSPDWIRLQYENQKPLQTVVGPLVQAGDEFAVVNAPTEVPEGRSAAFAVKADGALKLFWSLTRDGKEEPVAVDRFVYTFHAGRVTDDTPVVLKCRAVYATGARSMDFPVVIREDIEEPAFTLEAPAAWDGRQVIEVVPRVANLDAMQTKGAGELTTEWTVSPIAVIKEVLPGKLVLRRAQNSGTMTVTATISNRGTRVQRSTTIAVTEPMADAWVVRTPAREEKPRDGQFYARDDTNEGTLHYNGVLETDAESVFLRLYAGDTLLGTERTRPAADRSYALSVKLEPGLIRYRIEFGTETAGRPTVEHAVTDLVCGDAFIINGQSNALATDTAEKSPPVTHEWIRSYGRPTGSPQEDSANLWCRPVWKAEQGEKAELGWWGMQLAKQLVERHQIPVCIINAAVGGTRIDQHQRHHAHPTDLDTIYGRMLWRVQQAKLTHGIRAILWHQGESDQGSDGPTGGYGWETYQRYFIDMAAGWKQDFPNVGHYYVCQIWPDACSMGGRHGSGDMLREQQRTLPHRFSKLSVMSTLGIMPPGPCHFPLAGWAEIANLIQPLIERDVYGAMPSSPITPPNLQRAFYTDSTRESIALEFDQPVVWDAALAGQFYLDGEKDRVTGARVSGNVLTLQLPPAPPVGKITYLKEASWSQETLLFGANGLAALTFCNVPVAAGPEAP